MTAERDDAGRTRTPAILAVAAVVVAAIGVGGEFPLSDDWSYARSVAALCVDGELVLLPWSAPSLLLQLAYGTLVCKLVGFSFVALRASTIVLALLGVLALSRAARELRAPARATWIALACFGLSPLYLGLAFTFMTDVPLTALLVMATCAYLGGLRDDSSRGVLAGGMICAAAVLVRQNAIFLAAGVAAACLLAGGGDRRQRARLAAAAFAIPAVVFAGYHVWLFAWHGAPAGTARRVGGLLALEPRQVVNAGYRGAVTLGFLLAPLSAAVAGWTARRAPRLLAAVAAVLAGAGLVVFVREGATMFYLTNVLRDLGVGGLTLRDTLHLGLAPPVAVGAVLRLPLTLASIASAAVVAVCLVVGLRERASRELWLLILAAAALFAGSLLQADFYFDRYLLPVLPLTLLAVLAVRADLGAGALAGALAVLLAVFAVAGTHDYLAWNGARHAALQRLVDTGVSPREIDGGVEFNAWHLAAELGTWPTLDEARPGRPAALKSWWWVVDDRYVASFRPLAGYRLVDHEPYRRWLPPGRDRILILERGPATARQP